jgi:hypothetical protein
MAPKKAGGFHLAIMEERKFDMLIYLTGVSITQMTI